MRFERTVFIGVVAGAAMSCVMAAARAVGLQFNWEMMLGTLLGGEPSWEKWVVGLDVHLIISGLISLIYALGFECAAERADASTGLAFSFVHLVVAGVLMLTLPMIHPLMPAVMPEPMPFMSKFGLLGMCAFVLSHLIYGVTVGALYGPIQIPTRRPGCANNR